MEVKLNKEELITWLRTISGATLLSVSIVGQLDTLETNITVPSILASSLEQDSGFLGSGPYLVKYKLTPEEQHQDLSYETFATAVTFKVELKREPGKYIGGYNRIVKIASKYNYISRIKREHYGVVGFFLISLPANPVELEELKNDLVENSIAYIFPDGTGTINHGNLKMGKALRT
ncbi:hypothetical protein [Idiomarina sp.]|uniref:hypothetical protein n=1 Tax=Idiomarina sp. TaxID=1874361 RepID=UPI0025C672B2|nr:hypothetical protein [Idiomarina sp.]